MIDSAQTKVDFPDFDPKVKYSSSFELYPFFESVDDETEFLVKDDLVKKINSTIGRRHWDKYQPISVTASSGMGKTLLKCVGSQKVKEELECRLIKDALLYGRVLSFDFSNEAGIKSR